MAYKETRLEFIEKEEIDIFFHLSYFALILLAIVKEGEIVLLGVGLLMLYILIFFRIEVH